MLDPERQNRFLYPPVFFVASLLWGLHRDPIKSLGEFIPGATVTGSWDRIVAVAVTGSIVLIASGLLISMVSIGLLKALFRRSGKPYEAFLSDEALKSLWQDLNLPGEPKANDSLYLLVLLDHVLLPERVHRWVFRRWSMFYVCVNSATAIVLSLIAAPFLGITLYSAWPLEAIVASAVLVASGSSSWYDTVGMLEFQARHQSALRARLQPPASKTDA